MADHIVPANLFLGTCRSRALVLLLGGLFTAMAFSGCSQPLSGSMGSVVTETGRGIGGYTDTQYVYPVRVPESNQIVEMRVSKPLPQPPTYEDYLKWKESN